MIMMSVSKEDLREIRSITAYDYLSKYEPESIKKCGEKEYSLKEHDSLHINENGLWHWQSQGIGGKTALDCLIKVYGLDFKTAISKLSNKNFDYIPKPKVIKPKEPLKLPDRNSDTSRVFSYLVEQRGIDPNIVNYCLDNNTLFETAKYHACCFVGQESKYATLRGTVGSFRGECKNSDKRYSFRLTPSEKSYTLYVCESAIDVLSVATLVGEDWQEHHYLSLGGTSTSALDEYLKTNQPQGIKLYLDNDKAGRECAERIKEKFSEFPISYQPPNGFKDYNEMLISCIKNYGEKSYRTSEIER
jgi:hypothetical protein